MTTSVVIVSYRPGDWLAPCVASVVDQADQVVVVDNGSDAESASDIARRAGAEVVRSTRNRGFAGGFNLGLRHVHNDVVAVLNDDATAGPGWLDVAKPLLEDPTVAAVTPKVLLAGWWGQVTIDDTAWSVPGDHRRLGRRVSSIGVDGTDVLGRVVGGGLHRVEGGDGHHPVRWRWTAGDSPFYVPLDQDGCGNVTVNRAPVEIQAVCRLFNHAGSSLHRHGAASEFALGAPDDGRFDQRAERFGFSGTAPVFRTETLHRLGGLAAPFFAYNEDTDWCFRAHLAGMRIVYEPAATVRHRLSATSGGGDRPLVRFLAERNAVLSLVRNAPAPVARKVVHDKRHGPGDPRVRRSIERHLPWAVSSRAWMRRMWTTSPAAVWARWADVDLTWDVSPADTRWIAEHADPADRHVKP